MSDHESNTDDEDKSEFSAEEIKRLEHDDAEAVTLVSTRIMLDTVLLVARAWAMGMQGIKATLPASSPDVPANTRLLIASNLRNVAEGLLNAQEEAAEKSHSAPGNQLKAACERLGLPVETLHDWRDTLNNDPTGNMD